MIAAPKPDAIRNQHTVMAGRRAKTLMDVWCALWFWPLDKVGLLDGSDPAYPAAPVEVTHVTEEPAYDDPPVYEVAVRWADATTTSFTVINEDGPHLCGTSSGN